MADQDYLPTRYPSSTDEDNFWGNDDAQGYFDDDGQWIRTEIRSPSPFDFEFDFAPIRRQREQPTRRPRHVLRHRMDPTSHLRTRYEGQDTAVVVSVNGVRIPLSSEGEIEFAGALFETFAASEEDPATETNSSHPRRRRRERRSDRYAGISASDTLYPFGRENNHDGSEVSRAVVAQWEAYNRLPQAASNADQSESESDVDERGPMQPTLSIRQRRGSQSSNTELETGVERREGSNRQ